MKIVINSGGEPGSTTLAVDGRNVTDDEDVTSLSFYISSVYGGIDFSFSTREENDDGSVEVNNYSYYKNENEEGLTKEDYKYLGRGKAESAEDHKKAEPLGRDEIKIEDFDMNSIPLSRIGREEYLRMIEGESSKEGRSHLLSDREGEEDPG